VRRRLEGLLVGSVKIDALGRVRVEIDMEDGGAEVLAEGCRVEVF
jgi:hypothetical protein